MKLKSLCLLIACVLTGRAIAEVAGDTGRLIAQAASYQPGDSMDTLRHIESLVSQAVTNTAVRNRLEVELPNLLAPSASFAARRFACKQLAIIGTESALPALARLLQSPEDVGFACLALATYPPGGADRILRDALAGLRGNASVQIIQTLGDRRDGKAVALLGRLARSPDLPVARVAVVALGKIGSPSARKSLTKLLSDGLPELESVLVEAQAHVAERLAKSGNRKEAAAIYEAHLSPARPPSVRRAAFIALAPLDRDAGETRIFQTIRGSDATLRPVAITLARSLPSKTASSQLARELLRLPPQEQTWLIESLAVRADADARLAILLSLSSADANVRHGAASALTSMGDASCVAALSAALTRAKDPQEQQVLEATLGNLPGGAESDKALLAEVNMAQGEARARLILALAPRWSSEVRKTLFAEADSSNPLIAKAAYHSLASAGTGDQLPVLLGKFVALTNSGLRPVIGQAVAQAIVATEDIDQRSAAVRSALDHAADVETRCALFGFLPLCGDPQSLAAVSTALSDASSLIRDAALRALTDWPDASAWKRLMSIWQKPETEAQRSLALRGLVLIVDESNAQSSDELLGRYRALLQGAQSNDEFKLVLGALGGMGRLGALELALPLLARPGMRAEAEAAVRKIAEAIKDQYPQAAKDALEKLGAK